MPGSGGSSPALWPGCGSGLIEVAQDVGRGAPGQVLVAHVALAVFSENGLARRLGGILLPLVEAEPGVAYLEAAVIRKLRGQLPG